MITTLEFNWRDDMASVNIGDINRRLDRLKDELYLDTIAGRAKTRRVQRGQVYRCKFSVGVGSEENKERPCVILQYDGANKTSGNTIVAPITHTASTLDVVVPIADKQDAYGTVILDGYVLLGNITCVSKARLGDYITDLLPNEMKKIDNAIAISVDLKHYYKTQENIIKDKDDYIKKLKAKIEKLLDVINDNSDELKKLEMLMKEYGVQNIRELENLIKKD